MHDTHYSMEIFLFVDSIDRKFYSAPANALPMRLNSQVSWGWCVGKKRLHAFIEWLSWCMVREAGLFIQALTMARRDGKAREFEKGWRI